VSFNNGPTPVDDEVINLIRARIGSDGLVRMCEELKAGDEVIINEGRFQNFCGIFEREMDDADRVRILLNTVNFQAHVVVDRVMVNKLPQEKRSRVA
jgi:transcription antitermination factor NusG